MKRTNHIRTVEKQLRTRREALRRGLNRDLNSLKVHESGVGDEADASLIGEQMEIDSQLAEAETRELRQIDEALRRIHSGSYGKCDTCGSPIKAARLQAVPYATECIQCARAAERRPPEAAERRRWTWDTEASEPRREVSLNEAEAEAG